jgi:hypothetical protein
MGGAVSLDARACLCGAVERSVTVRFLWTHSRCVSVFLGGRVVQWHLEWRALLLLLYNLGKREKKHCHDLFFLKVARKNE